MRSQSHPASHENAHETSNASFAERRGFRSILIATDLSPEADHAVARAMHLPISRITTLHLVHALPAGLRPVPHAVKMRARRSLEALADRIRRTGRFLTVTSEVAYGPPVRSIYYVARAVEADLIVLGRSVKSGLRRMLFGKTAEAIIRWRALPVLVVNGAPMGPYRRGMAAIDLTPNAFATLEGARAILDASAEPLTVLHATEDPAPAAGDQVRDRPEALRPRLAALARARTQATTLLGEKADGAALRIAVRLGDPRRLVPEFAAATSRDLVIVASRGLGRVAYGFDGSISSRVVRAAPVDVLVVPPSFEFLG